MTAVATVALLTAFGLAATSCDSSITGRPQADAHESPTMTSTPPGTPTTEAAPTTTITPPPATTAESIPWPVALYAIGIAPSPQFPATLDGWRMSNKWSDRPRAFGGPGAGGDPSAGTRLAGPGNKKFPATMNGCNNQRFLVRWRAVNDGALIDAYWLDAVGRPRQIVTATAGWMAVGGCETPTFHYSDQNTGPGNLSDVAVDVQQWLPAP